MQRLFNLRLVFLSSESAASNLEYALLLGLIATATTGGVLAMGKNAQSSMQLAETGASGSRKTAPPSVPPTPTPTKPKTVFADTFSNSKASAAKWDFNGSWWKVNNGKLQAGPVSGWNNLTAYAIGSTFANGTVSMDATLKQGWGYGLLFDLSGDPVKGNINGYSFQYDAGWGTGAFTLKKWVNGVEIAPPLAVAWPGADYRWDGVQRHIAVTREGSVITAVVDGKTVMTVSDSTYTSGGVGLRLWNDPSATFDNFKVSAN